MSLSMMISVASIMNILFPTGTHYPRTISFLSKRDYISWYVDLAISLNQFGHEDGLSTFQYALIILESDYLIFVA